MAGLPIAKPEEIGLHPVRTQRVYDLLEQWAKTDKIPGASLCIGRRGKILEPRFFGRHRPEVDAPALRNDALFLIASITKPVTVTAVMLLTERGLITIEDPVARYVPRF